MNNFFKRSKIIYFFFFWISRKSHPSFFLKTDGLIFFSLFFTCFYLLGRSPDGRTREIIWFSSAGLKEERGAWHLATRKRDSLQHGYGARERKSSTTTSLWKVGFLPWEKTFFGEIAQLATARGATETTLRMLYFWLLLITAWATANALLELRTWLDLAPRRMVSEIFHI